MLTGQPVKAGQYLTVVCERVPELMEVRGRELVDHPSLTDRLGHAELVWSRVSRDTATVALRPGTARAARRTHVARRVTRAGAWTATGWPATMESAVRSGRTQREPLSDVTTKVARMTLVQELTGLDTAVELGAERLLSLQHPDGWWKGELESNATMIAEHLFLHHFLGLRDAETAAAGERAARATTRRRNVVDLVRGARDLSVTVEAYRR